MSEKVKKLHTVYGVECKYPYTEDTQIHRRV